MSHQINAQMHGLLGECLLAIDQLKEPGKLMAEICRILVSAEDYSAAWIGFAENDPEKTVKFLAQSDAAASYLSKVKITWDEASEHGRGPAGTALRTGVTQLTQNILEQIDTMHPWWEQGMKHGFLSVIALPLNSSHYGKGVLTLYSSKFNAFTEDDVTVLEQIASAVGTALQ